MHDKMDLPKYRRIMTSIIKVKDIDKKTEEQINKILLDVLEQAEKEKKEKIVQNRKTVVE